uniref:Uncharacterized protein n=1 Tax=Kocuria rosea subsp. polaris TaxID=136273 RepID=A0A0A6VNE2_KOCRO|nr:hypothetical protein GY22_17080 [Kocuria polaris]
MPGRVEKHSPLLRGGLVLGGTGADCYGSGDGRLQVLHGDVQVYLLLLRALGPGERDVVPGAHQREHRACPWAP